MDAFSMHIQQAPDSNRLVISHLQVFIASLIGGSVVLLMAFSFLYATSRRYAIICQRLEPTQVRCDYFTPSKSIQNDAPTQFLNQVERAVLGTVETVDSIQYQLILENSQNRPGIQGKLMPARHQVEPQIAAINQFLADPKQAKFVSILRPHFSPVIPFVVILWGMCGGLLIISKFCDPIRIEFQRDICTQNLKIKLRWPFHTQHLSINTVDISKLETTTVTSLSEGEEGNSRAVYAIHLKLKSGKVIHLDQRMLTTQEFSEMVEQLSDFLHLQDSISDKNSVDI